MKNSMLTPAKTMPGKKKPKHKGAAMKPTENVTPKDMAFDRNFTSKGKPRLSAQSGDGSMGHRR
jgi:hypothetical protein